MAIRPPNLWLRLRIAPVSLRADHLRAMLRLRQRPAFSDVSGLFSMAGGYLRTGEPVV
jgi:hypothetical protein